jgi:hypothetical protein
LGTSKSCECNTKQIEWLLFNKFLAVPEYIINFEYINKVRINLKKIVNIGKIFEAFSILKIKNAHLNEYDKELANFESKSSSKTPSLFVTGDPEPIKNMRVANSPKTEELVKTQIEIDLRKFEDNFNNITHLNLHNVGLSTADIETLNNLKSVTHLFLSYNNLKYLKDCQIFVNFSLLV